MAKASWEWREEVVRAVLRRLSAEHGDQDNAYYAAEDEYADDWIDSASKELAEALKAEASAKSG